jgi:hypothetical protein
MFKEKAVSKSETDWSTHDLEFARSHPQMNNPAPSQEIAEEVFRVAEKAGVPRDKVVREYLTNPALRSADMQAKWYAAAKQRIDQRNASPPDADLSVRSAAKMLSRRRRGL